MNSLRIWLESDVEFEVDCLTLLLYCQNLNFEQLKRSVLTIHIKITGK